MTLLSPRRELGEFKKRYKWMALAVSVAFGTLGSRLVYLQAAEHEHYAEIARENITKTIVLPATRGLLRDRHGAVIAENRPSYDVLVTPSRIDREQDVPRIAELMKLTDAQVADFLARLDAVPLRRRAHQIEMFSDATREQLAALETHASELRGVDVIARPVRHYPFGKLAAHAVGYLNEVSAEDLEKLRDDGYRPGDVLGRSGIERAWEGYLRGRRGFRRVVVDARGREQELPAMRTAAHPEMRREPEPGRDLVLTLDMELMRIVERAFRGHPSGSTVVVDVHTGRVRALFSKPSYDLNEMTGRLTSARYAELVEDPFRPLIDKTLYESYFPGSTFKPMSALAGLADGIVDPSSRVECFGFYELGKRRFRCTQAHGDVDLRSALVQSCNVYFYRLAEQVGLDRIAKYAHDFGFGGPSGIGINTEAAGTITTREWYEREHGTRFRLGFTLNAAIGQGNTRATLLQLALAYAALANGGTLYVPQLVERVTAPDGTVIEEFPARVRRQVSVRPQHLALVNEGLVGVVNAPNGTAYEARIEGGVPIAGKTGTAQVSRRAPREGESPADNWYFNRDHAWFAGFAPADAPEVAIVTLVEHGGGGGKTAAPIAVQILEEHLRGQAGSTARAGGSGADTRVARGGG